MISTGNEQIDVSSYLTPKSPHKDITWEETESEYIIKLKPTISTSAMMTPILACKDLSLGSSVAFLTT